MLSIRRTPVRIGLVAGIALGLGACGGSGGSTAPDGGASVPGPTGGNQQGTSGGDNGAGSQKVVMRGAVTDAPIPNARVVITVGERVFEASALTDMNGAYEVEVDGADPDDLVYCEAFDASGGVHFAAVPSTFGELQSDAVDGAVENMNITNLTTAHHVLVRQFLEGGVIESADQLRDMAQFVDSRALLELAGAIKLVVEQREGIALPAGVGDTLELAEAIAAGDSTFLSDVEATNPGALDRALQDVVTDGYAVLPVTAATATGVYADIATDDLLALFETGGFVAEQGVTRALQDWSVASDGRVGFQAEGDPMKYLAVLARSEELLNAVVGQQSGAVDSYPTYAFRAFSGAFDAQLMAGTHVFSDRPELLHVFSAGGGGYVADAATGAGLEDFSWQVGAAGRITLGFPERSVTLYRLEGSLRGRELTLAVTDAGGQVSVAVVTLERSE